MSTPALRLRGIRKYFGSVSALEEVSLDAYAGEVHAVVGDNGAGKSTMIKVITGIHRADAGEVLVDGEDLAAHSAADAQERGIAVVYQDLGISKGMHWGIADADAAGRPVEYRTLGTWSRPFA